MVSDIPAGDGNIEKLFLLAKLSKLTVLYYNHRSHYSVLLQYFKQYSERKFLCCFLNEKCNQLFFPRVETILF